MIDKEKVRELLNDLGDYETDNGREKHLTRWLEQNQPAPVAVGLSDEQSLSLAQYICFYTQSMNTDYKWLIDAWLSKQTFAQVKEVVVGLSDEY